jgi:N-acyl-D-amino-acid deacylase
MPRHDVVIREAAIYDGTGAAPVVGDVAIQGDGIVEVGSVAGDGRETIDGRGFAVAPGFIDVHTHDDFAAVFHPDLTFKVAGGVTTCIVGNCGMGVAPFEAAARMAKTFHPDGVLPRWQGHAGYAAQLASAPPAANVGALIGHGTVRLAAMGTKSTAPSAAEMAAMRASVAEGVEAGALGLSSGLIYQPGCFAVTDELVELAALFRGTGGLYATHMRDESLGLLESVREAIAIGEGAGVPVQISHHKASGRAAWGLVRESLRLIEGARGRGLAVRADQYPYTAGSTVLSAVFHKGRFESGLGSFGADDIVVASAPAHPAWEGQSIAAVAATLGLEPAAAAAHVLDVEPETTIVLHGMCEEDVETVLRHPTTMIGSDGIPTLDGKPHPRLYGTFARVLGRYARELGVLSLAEAVHRMTGLPAETFGLEGRGVLRPGAYADVVLFDPMQIIDRGSFEDPHQTPAGIAAVFVNGIRVAADGRSTGARPGRVLRRRGS